MDELTTIIHEYEGDTFSGADITQTEARLIALRLFTRFLKVVRTGGTLRRDGLAGLLEEVQTNA